MERAASKKLLESSRRSQSAGCFFNRSDWGLFECKTDTVKCEDEVERVLSYSIPELPEPLVLHKPITGKESFQLYCPMARRLSPSEEVLGWYICNNAKKFEGARVLELGAGLGLAGLLCAAVTKAKEVLLTDGDPTVVKTLGKNVERNLQLFGDVKVSTRLLSWENELRDSMSPCRKNLGQFDFIIAADIVYEDSAHHSLLALFKKFLRIPLYRCQSEPMIILFASKRTGSLEKFIFDTRSAFPRTQVFENYDSMVSAQLSGMKCFPLLVLIRNMLVAPDKERPASAVVRNLRDLEKRNRGKIDGATNAILNLSIKHRYMTNKLVSAYKSRKEIYQAEVAEEKSQLESKRVDEMRQKMLLSRLIDPDRHLCKSINPMGFHTSLLTTIKYPPWEEHIAKFFKENSSDERDLTKAAVITGSKARKILCVNLDLFGCLSGLLPLAILKYLKPKRVDCLIRKEEAVVMLEKNIMHNSKFKYRSSVFTDLQEIQSLKRKYDLIVGIGNDFLEGGNEEETSSKLRSDKIALVLLRKEGAFYLCLSARESCESQFTSYFLNISLLSDFGDYRLVSVSGRRSG